MFQLVCGSSKLLSMSGGWKNKREGGREGGTGGDAVTKSHTGPNNCGQRCSILYSVRPCLSTKCSYTCSNTRYLDFCNISGFSHPYPTTEHCLHGAHQVHAIHIKPTNKEENILAELFDVFVKQTKLLGKPVYQFWVGEELPIAYNIEEDLYACMFVFCYVISNH